MSKSLFTIEPLTPADSQWVRQFIVKHWHAETVVAHGQEFYPHRLPGFVAVSDMVPFAERVTMAFGLRSAVSGLRSAVSAHREPFVLISDF